MLLKKIEFFSTSQIKHFSVILLNFSRQVYKLCILRVHGNSLKEKCFFFWQIPFSLVLRKWRSNFRTFTQTLLVSLVKTAFEVTRETIWSKLISFTKHRKVSPLFGNEWKIFRLVGEKLWNYCQICTRRSQLFFKETFFLKFEWIFLSFSNSTTLFYFCPRHFSVRVSRTDLCLPEDHFKEKHLVWAIWFKISTVPGFEPNNCRTSGDNCSAALSN